MRTTWVPGDIIDVVQARARARDPEADLYQPSRSWVLVMNGEMLQGGPALGMTIQSLFVCVEAIREKPCATAWERRARRVFFCSS
jgi:hypothetical protein